jgi:type I restriction enzyme, S subunit
MTSGTRHTAHPLPEGWRWVRLGDVCQLNPPRPSLDRADDVPTTFVPMAAVEEAGHGISKAELKPFGKVRKGYTYFEEGDVIFAKITPCMQNGKHAIVCDLLGGFGFGSTEFHVIRPKAGAESDWILKFVMQPSILQDAKAHFTGAVGQQRVPESYLQSLELPLPPLSEQRRITATLNEQMAAVDRARAAAEAQLEAAEQLPAAYLRKMFESPRVAEFPRRPLGEILRLRKEVIHPRDNPKGRDRFVGLEHIESTTGIRTGYVDVEMSELTGRKLRFYESDIVYGYLRPYLNKVWVAEFDGLCSVDQYVYSVVSNLANSDYVAWFMRSPTYLKRAPISTSPGQLPRIRTDEVASVEIELPSLSQQQTLVAELNRQFAAINRTNLALQELSKWVVALPQALLQRAFHDEPVVPGTQVTFG